MVTGLCKLNDLEKALIRENIANDKNGTLDGTLEKKIDEIRAYKNILFF